jgi:hypothetical protein
MQTLRPLNYRSAPTETDPRHWTLIWIISLIAGAFFLGLLVWSVGWFAPGTTPTILPPAVVVIPSPGIAPGVVPAGDAATKAAAAAAGKTLDDLLNGKSNSDPNLAQVAGRFQNFRQWAITSASKMKSNPPSVTFTGSLYSGDTVELNGFTLQMVQQQDGTWKPGAISGPNPR